VKPHIQPVPLFWVKKIAMIKKEDLQKVIPHSGKMLLLSKIIDYNMEERRLTAEYHITEDCLFFDSVSGGVPAWAAFECIAQAFAALSGISGSKTGEKPKIGFILSVSKMQIFLPIIKPGSTIVINVKELDNMDSVYNFDGNIFLEGSLVLEGKFTVKASNGEII